jgi:hypothetical protein
MGSGGECRNKVPTPASFYRPCIAYIHTVLSASRRRQGALAFHRYGLHPRVDRVVSALASVTTRYVIQRRPGHVCLQLAPPATGIDSKPDIDKARSSDHPVKRDGENERGKQRRRPTLTPTFRAVDHLDCHMQLTEPASPRAPSHRSSYLLWGWCNCHGRALPNKPRSCLVVLSRSVR